MKEIYSDYLLKILRQGSENISENYTEITREIALDGKIDKLIELTQKYLNNLSNRDYMQFSEKYIKLIIYCIAMNLKIFRTKSEMEVQRKYPDLLLVPKDKTKEYKGVMLEFKYLKRDEKNKLREKQEEAKKQIEEYKEFEEIREFKNISSYTVIVVNDKIYFEKID